MSTLVYFIHVLLSFGSLPLPHGRHAEIELRLEEIGSSTAVERAKGLLQKLGFTEALMVGAHLNYILLVFLRVP